MVGREITAGVERLCSIGEALVSAVEKLNDSPVLEIESGPALCPHCKTLNPVVIIEPTDGRGNLADLVIECDCCECSKTFYARPLNFRVYETQLEILNELESEAESNG